MSTELRGYRRVASLYKWDYQKAEMALADAMEELNRLRRSAHKLDAEIDTLLEGDGAALLDAGTRDGLLRLASELRTKLEGYRKAHDLQVLIVLDLRKQLMMAKVRKDKSHEKHREAVAALWQARTAKQVEELSDVHVANLVRQRAGHNVDNTQP
jgi:hypothetical protein